MRFYFTPLVGVLFTFPSRYLFTIGRRGVLRLGGWSPHVQTGFHVSRPTRVCRYLTPTGLSPTMAALSRSVRLYVTTALAWSRFARHYYGSLGRCTFLQVLRC